jgi:hypothetical protein
MSSKAFACCLLPFIVLATLNAGGYRYGASDQAFYLPVVLKKVDPGLFPRDSALLAAQSTLTMYDEVVAAIVRISGASLPTIFAVLYVVALILIAAGTWLVARGLAFTTWTTVALLAAMTLRHAIARSGTNTLEGYFHPRQIAFGLGLLAVAAFLRRSFGVTLVLVLVAGSVHPTAALWFALWLCTAMVITSPAARKVMGWGAIALGAAATWALVSGPLAGRLAPMDDEWLYMLAEKDYLFILEWPAYAWLFNLGYVAIVAAVYRQRRRADVVSVEERALVFGSAVLLLVFVAAVIAQSLHVALAFQLQPARLFLIFDFLAAAYVVWALAQMPRRAVLRPAVVAAIVIAFSCVRGIYVLWEANRPPVQLALQDGDWQRAMNWAKTTPKASHWLADPYHAILYGSSVRVAAERDVFVEAVKDAALGIYDRRIAERTAERRAELEEFAGLTVDRARSLAAFYDLDYMVTDRSLDLPVVFQSGALRIYKLR